MHVVATAGHVDHGKSTLVRALTGREPDRLEEERRRGLSIQLGYAWTTLPGVGEVAFVDVPGHERFFTTTLSGLGPAPVAMLVVAADDPWMPQAAEHLAALDALGVTSGLVAVTRADLADPGPAAARARHEVDATSLAGAPLVIVSGRTGEGLDALRAALAGVLRSVGRPDAGADVRLWVDRRFHVRGAGTVVTGTLPAGVVAVGDRLQTAGRDVVRVRRLESLEVSRERVQGPARVALDLGGRAPADLGPGTWLTTPGAFAPTTLVDVEVTGDGVPERPLLHVGSSSTAVRARPLGDRFLRLALPHPLPLRVGDRAVVRDPGSRALWGVRVLDPAPPALERRGAAAARARDLASLDGTAAADLAVRRMAERETLRRIGVPLDPPPAGAVEADGWLLSPGRAADLRDQLEELVRDRPASAPPLTREAAARALGLPTPALVPDVEPTPRAPLEPWLEKAVAVVREALLAAPYDAPDRTWLRELGLVPPVLARLDRERVLLRLEGDVVLLPGADEGALEVLRALDPPFTPSDARVALGTSRRVVMPLLDHLDRTGRTVRLADGTRRVR